MNNFSKDMENIMKNQYEIKGKNTVTELKGTLMGSSLDWIAEKNTKL